MRTKTIVISLLVAVVVVFIGLYFFQSFFSAFAPPNVTITEQYISTNEDFINGITIETIHVDSMSEGHPVKYTVTRLTTCHIDHPEGRPPNPPDKIYFNKKGKYWWTEENVNIPFIHEGLSRHTTDSSKRLLWSMGARKFLTCPLVLQRGQWYFFTLGDPQIVGIFFYIDKKGEAHQFTQKSGVSPI